jgi:CRISPR-associated protein Csx10
MIAITYQIHLDEPAIFAALEGDPNSAVTYPYIPGSVIRGMIIGRFIQSQRTLDKHFELEANGQYSQLFFSPKTRYLNAYPRINGKRSLPVPATWTISKYKKSDEKIIYITDTACKPKQQNDDERRKPKSLSGFTVVESGTAHVYQPKTAINVHTARARKDASEQQVFRYESLADGQSFMGAILCETKTDAEKLQKLLKGTKRVALGGSRTAGYGHATISEVQIESNWSELTPRMAKNVVLTFLSDTLLCDEHGAYIPSPKILQAQLEQMGIVCELEPVSIKTSWVGGFNRKWGLPLPQVMGIERGSVVRLNGINPEDSSIKQLLNKGIGERREDGFGRVAIGWQQQATLTYQKYDPTPVLNEITLKPASESARLLQTIERRIEANEMQDIRLRILQDDPYLIRGNISRTQLSRLRTEIANASSLSEVTRFLTKISGKAGGRQFDNARISGQSLTEWLKKPTFGDNASSDEATILQLIDLVLERAYIVRDKQAVQKEVHSNG